MNDKWPKKVISMCLTLHWSFPSMVYFCSSSGAWCCWWWCCRSSIIISSVVAWITSVRIGVIINPRRKHCRGSAGNSSESGTGHSWSCWFFHVVWFFWQHDDHTSHGWTVVWITLSAQETQFNAHFYLFSYHWRPQCRVHHFHGPSFLV